jgi:hypothetical protein
LAKTLVLIAAVVLLASAVTAAVALTRDDETAQRIQTAAPSPSAEEPSPGPSPSPVFSSPLPNATQAATPAAKATAAAPVPDFELRCGRFQNSENIFLCKVRSIGGFREPVTLSCRGDDPRLADCEFYENSNPLTPPANGETSVIVSEQHAFEYGTYTGEVVAQGGGRTRTAAFTIRIVPLPTYTVDCGGAALDVPWGGGATRDCRLTSNVGYTADIMLGCGTSLPEGVTCSAPAIHLPPDGSVVVPLRVAVVAPARSVGSLTVYGSGPAVPPYHLAINVVGAPSPPPPDLPGFFPMPSPSSAPST